jgi:hypothetical protein
VFRPGPGLVECFGCGGGALESAGGSEEGRKEAAGDGKRGFWRGVEVAGEGLPVGGARLLG